MQDDGVGVGGAAVLGDAERGDRKGSRLDGHGQGTCTLLPSAGEGLDAAEKAGDEGEEQDLQDSGQACARLVPLGCGAQGGHLVGRGEARS